MVDGSVSKRRRIYERDEGSCVYCGVFVDFDDMTLEHLVAKSRADEYKLDSVELHDDSNLASACYDCNKLKANRSLKDFFRGRMQAQLEFLLRIEDFANAKVYDSLQGKAS